MEKLVIAGREFSSRLFLGTGKFDSNALMAKAIEASGTEMVTVAMKRVELEDDYPKGLACALGERGHELAAGDSVTFGRGQIIWRDEDGVLCGATEPRADGGIAAY